MQFLLFTLTPDAEGTANAVKMEGGGPVGLKILTAKLQK